MSTTIISVSENSVTLNVTPTLPLINIVSGFAGGGTTVTGANVGSGAGVFKQKISGTLQFKSIVAGNLISITNGTNDITIDTVTPSIGNVLTLGGNNASNTKITNLGQGTLASDAARLSDIPTGLPPNGAAGGDLSGTYPSPTLATQGGLSAATYGDGTHYPVLTINTKGIITAASVLTLPTSLPPTGSAGGDLSGTYPNPSVATAAITYGKIQNVSAFKLIGNPTGSSTTPSEIGLGSGLAFDGTNIDVVLPPVSAWLIGGNANGAEQTIGTLDNFDLPIIVNNIETMRLKTSGLVQLLTTTQDDTKTRMLALDSSGNIYWRDVATIVDSTSTLWSVVGNTVGTTKKIGTIDNFDFPIIVHNIETARFTKEGNLGLGHTAASTNRLDVIGVAAGNIVRLRDNGDATDRFIVSDAGAITITQPVNNNGNVKVLTVNSSTGVVEYRDASTIGSTGTGTVTSVSSGSISGIMTVNVATATTTPAFTFSLNNQTTKTFLAGPVSGSPAAPTFRTIAATDLVLNNGSGTLWNSGTGAVDIDPTYIGQTSITDLGTITTGTWNASPIDILYGGTGLSSLGTANQLLGVNSTGTALEYKTFTTGVTYSGSSVFLGGAVSTSIIWTLNASKQISIGGLNFVRGAGTTKSITTTSSSYQGGITLTCDTTNGFNGPYSQFTAGLSNIYSFNGYGDGTTGNLLVAGMGINTDSFRNNLSYVFSSNSTSYPGSLSTSTQGIFNIKKSVNNEASIAAGFGINVTYTLSNRAAGNIDISTQNTIYGDATSGSESINYIHKIYKSGALSNALTIKAATSMEFGVYGPLLLASNASDYTGVNGYLYYNTATNSFRGYYNSTWDSLSLLSRTETLSNKTLISPILNTSSTIGWVWTATDTVGGGAWQVSSGGGGGGGTVTSVGLSAPSIFTVSGSPIISSGTLGFTLNTQTANTIFVGPTTGSAAAPTFRAMVTADIPNSIVTVAKISATGTPSSSTYLRGDGAWATVIAGLTNSAANTELMKSDGTNAISSKIFAPSNGNLTLGDTGLTGGRTIQVSSSGTNAALVLQSQGASSFVTIGGTSWGGNFSFSSPGSGIVQISGAADYTLGGYFSLTTPGGNISAPNGTDIKIISSSAYAASGDGAGGNLVLQSGQRRTAGIGLDGNITINPLKGWVIIPNTSSTPTVGTDTATMYVNDITAGNAAPFFKTEAGNVIKLYTTNSGSAYSITNGTTDRTYDANSTSLDELADILYTLIQDLKLSGLIA